MILLHVPRDPSKNRIDHWSPVSSTFYEPSRTIQNFPVTQNHSIFLSFTPADYQNIWKPLSLYRANCNVHVRYRNSPVVPTYKFDAYPQNVEERVELNQEVKIFVKGRRLITITHCKEFANFGLLKNTSIIDSHTTFNLFLGYPIKVLSFDKYFQACKSWFKKLEFNLSRATIRY